MCICIVNWLLTGFVINYNADVIGAKHKTGNEGQIDIM